MHEIIKNDHRASMHGYVSYIGNLTMKIHWKIWSQGETLMYVHLEKLWVDSLQRTRLPAGIFLLFLTLKTIKKIPVGKWDSYTRMLQMNPPFVYSGYCRGKGDRNFITFSINSRAK